MICKIMDVMMSLLPSVCSSRPVVNTSCSLFGLFLHLLQMTSGKSCGCNFFLILGIVPFWILCFALNVVYKVWPRLPVIYFLAIGVRGCILPQVRHSAI